MKYQHFDLQETMGLSEPLKEGYVMFKLGDKKLSFKSLYVPGVGWCPITKELSEDFTNIPEGLALYCPIDAKDDDIKLGNHLLRLCMETLGGILFHLLGLISTITICAAQKKYICNIMQ